MRVSILCTPTSLGVVFLRIHYPRIIHKIRVNKPSSMYHYTIFIGFLLNSVAGWGVLKNNVLLAGYMAFLLLHDN